MTTDNQMPRSTAEAQGISSAAILEFVEAAEKHLHEIQSLVLVRHGCIVAEGWWSPYSAEHPHMMFSLSKSFTSTAVGLAVSERRISLDDKVLSFFSEDAPSNVSANLVAMRVRDLLTMNSGHAEDSAPIITKRADGNWVKGFLEQPVIHAPGSQFCYDSGATFMLSAIVQKVTGLTLVDYLEPRLFEPLGIEKPVWDRSPQGINVGGVGLHLKTEDIARFGQMYLQKGLWNGRRILPEAWVNEATSRLTDSNLPGIDWQQGYGYQFWQCRHGVYRGDGAFGQFCIVIEEHDAVLAMTSGTDDMQAVLDLVWDMLLPAFGTNPLRADSTAAQKLAQKLSGLVFVPPQGQHMSPAADISGKVYPVEANPRGITSVALDFSDPGCIATIRTANGEHRVDCGLGNWHEGTTTLYDRSSAVAASGVWIADDAFAITLRFYETPFWFTLTCHINGDRMVVETTSNVDFWNTGDWLVGHFA